jgi:DNA-binding transcriptional ArsR family regulator
MDQIVTMLREELATLDARRDRVCKALDALGVSALDAGPPRREKPRNALRMVGEPRLDATARAVQKATRTLNETQDRIVEFLAQNGRATAHEIGEGLGLPRSVVSYQLVVLYRAGRLDRVLVSNQGPSVRARVYSFSIRPRAAT